MSEREECRSKLCTLYHDFWQHWKQVCMTETNYELSPPLLIDPPSEYFDARHRLLIVGQQTCGWSWDGPMLNQTDDHVEALMSQYRGFDLGSTYRSTPFWAAARKLNNLLNGDGDAKFLWGNLVRTDEVHFGINGRKRYRRPPEHIEENLCRFTLLQREIEILEPRVVVFFTGPYYDIRLIKSFVDGATLHEVNDLQVLDRVVHSKVPNTSYRCYHPGYLRRRGLTDEYLNCIVSDVFATLGS